MHVHVPYMEHLEEKKKTTCTLFQWFKEVSCLLEKFWDTATFGKQISNILCENMWKRKRLMTRPFKPLPKKRWNIFCCTKGTGRFIRWHASSTASRTLEMPHMCWSHDMLHVPIALARKLKPFVFEMLHVKVLLEIESFFVKGCEPFFSATVWRGNMQDAHRCLTDWNLRDKKRL